MYPLLVKLAVGFSKETCLLFLYISSGLLGYLSRSSPVQQRPTQKSPIVFVHGWLTQNPIYFRLKRSLEHEGFAVYMTDFGLHLDDFHAISKRLNEYIEERQLDNVILIGASGGAVAALVYLQKMNGWKHVRRFIGIGGPYKGTPLAYFAFFSKAGRQMIPNSNFVRELFQEEVKNAHRITCVSAKYDELVPSSSSQLPGAHNVTLDVVGHVNLQAFSRDTYKTITENAL